MLLVSIGFSKRSRFQIQGLRRVIQGSCPRSVPIHQGFLPEWFQVSHGLAKIHVHGRSRVI